MPTVLYEIDDNGFITGVHDPLDAVPTAKLIDVPPVDGLHRARWTGTEWVEDMPQSEIDELNKPIDSSPTDTEILGQQMTEREIEAMTQGQQITDIELRMMIYEMGAV